MVPTATSSEAEELNLAPCGTLPLDDHIHAAKRVVTLLQVSLNHYAAAHIVRPLLAISHDRRIQ